LREAYDLTVKIGGRIPNLVMSPSDKYRGYRVSVAESPRWPMPSDTM
jgi:hypothetical protein